ncbi:hypothetical protein IGI04_042614 [Brassica rapa subsp. trilocularis]|uniref:Uncharacterized protein n=1 Tax=Brassica rapa subsp. trilocularis TaxID=1813537 RepID=A0ABQ7KKJ2_BRACM|nr:hypothetical protein IGI04_042614 [Brassica rapa subsp. trilocularis]
MVSEPGCSKGVFLVFLSVLGESGLCSSVTRLVWIFLMETNNLGMEMKHSSSITLKLEEETGGSWSRWAKAVLRSCVLWSSHKKGKPLRRMATEAGQAWSLRYEDRVVQENHTRCGIEAAHGSRSDLKKVCGVKRANTDLRRGKEELHQLVGKLKYLWRELDLLRSRTSDPEVIQERLEQDVVLSLLVSLNSSYGQLIMQVAKDDERVDVDGLCELVQSSYKVYEKSKRLIRIRDGTRCKKGRLRRLSRTWVMVRKTQRKSRQCGYFGNDMETRLIKEFAQHVVRGECSYSAYMGSSVEESVVMKGQGTKGADDPITKKEWDGFVKYHQGDSGHHDQEVTQEVENFPQVDEQGEVHDQEEVSETETEVQAEIKAWEVTLNLFGEGITSKGEQGVVWIRFGHSWKGEATLQPVQACEASQQPASLDFTCFESHFEIPFVSALSLHL